MWAWASRLLRRRRVVRERAESSFSSVAMMRVLTTSAVDKRWMCFIDGAAPGSRLALPVAKQHKLARSRIWRASTASPSVVSFGQEATMPVGETLFERVVGEKVITEREEAEYGSLPAFYALADGRF